jgi:hypothetical protein
MISAEQKKTPTSQEIGVFGVKAWQWSGPPPEATGVRPVKARKLAFI